MFASRRINLAVAGGAFVTVLSLAVYLFSPAPVWRGNEEQGSIDITMYVEQFAFSPSRTKVRRGQRVNLKILSKDVTHGVFIDGYGIKKEIIPGRPTLVTFIADKPGKIQIRCAVICGSLHPFMLGEIVVEPNSPFWSSSAALLLLAAVMVGFTGYARSTNNPHPKAQAGLDLLAFPLVKRIFRWRGFQFTLMIPGLAILVLAILSGFWGTPIGAKNFSMISVWIIWWGALVLLFLPFAARAWCVACPVPAAGEWLSRKAFVERTDRLLGLGLGWPRRLRNRWLVSVALLLVLLFGLIITTRPWATALLILSLIVAALVIHFVFERRAFCRYVCPIGGFLGLYAMVSPLELRTKDRSICRTCTYKACYRGSSEDSLRSGGGPAYGCPNFEFIAAMERNIDCILCSECVKACPYDNIALKTRPFLTDLFNSKRWRMDEAWLSLILLGTALVNLATKLGHWGWLKDWANLGEPNGFLIYTLLFLLWSTVLLPAGHWLVSWLSRQASGRRDVSTRTFFMGYAYALAPLSLMIWIAFTVSFMLPNFSYIVPVLSDPFGWGSDLFGMREHEWIPYLTGWLPYIQVASLVIGLLVTLKVGTEVTLRIVGAGRPALIATVPFAFSSAGMGILFLALFRG
jgi:polyferredoxin